jgi:cytochrome P450
LTTTTVAGVDPLGAQYLADPYPLLARLREESPVVYMPGVRMWAVTRFADVKEILRDTETFSAANAESPVLRVTPEALEIVRSGLRLVPVLANCDGGSHLRIRRRVMDALARRTAGLEPFVRAQAKILIDAVSDQTSFDVVEVLCLPLPEATIFRLLGFPASDADRIRHWCGDKLVVNWGAPTPAAQVASARRTVEFWRYLEDLVQTRRDHQEDDLISDLAGPPDGRHQTLTAQEIASVAFVFTFAGQETTTGLLTNCLRQLLSVPERWTEICRDPSLIPDAVEETLRYDTSVIAWRRITTREAMIGDVCVPERARLLLILGAANRDPEMFDAAEEFSLRRSSPAPGHLAFGWGEHHCLGAALARLEACTVLEFLACQMPGLRLDANQPLRFPANVSFRRPLDLWVAVQLGSGRAV